MAFHLGSLGFLTPFEFVNFEEQMINVLEGKLIGWTLFFHLIKNSALIVLILLIIIKFTIELSR